jgi:hypothetical protein
MDQRSPTLRADPERVKARNAPTLDKFKKTIWYRSGLNSFYCRPSRFSGRRCCICNAICEVNRNVLCAGSFGEHFGGGKSRYDHFFCKHVGENWHDSVTELVDEALTARDQAALDEYARRRGIRGVLRRIVELLGD